MRQGQDISSAKGDAVIVLNAVIAAVTDEVPRLLMVRRTDHALATEIDESLPGDHSEDAIALPFGPFDPSKDRTLELALRQWVEEQTGLSIGYVEQLYTFGDRYRDPRELAGGPRVVSIGYFALGQESTLAGAGEGDWFDWYDFLPWEDWRQGCPAMISDVIVPALDRWVVSEDDDATQHARRERLALTFGVDDVAWDYERVLERYELLYEAGLVAEAERDRRAWSQFISVPAPLSGTSKAIATTGHVAALDHRRMMATALERLRGKLKYKPVVFELLPDEFTLLQLQRVVESLAGACLHKQNFRRLVMNNGLVEATGRRDMLSRGRPAETYQFRSNVLSERPAPGIDVSTRVSSN